MVNVIELCRRRFALSGSRNRKTSGSELLRVRLRKFLSRDGKSFLGLASWLVLAQAEQPFILRLEPRDRVKLLLALASVAVLGFVLILFAWWAARVTRRYINSASPADRRKRRTAVKDDDWATKPLYAADDDASGNEG